MGEFKLDGPVEEPKIVEQTIIEQENSSHNAKVVEEPLLGLTEEEINDPNKIKVTVSDEETPIVVLFGPPASGKTMTLVRLTRYLNKHGYEVTPVRTFRSSVDTHYQKMCDSYNEMVNSDSAASSTALINFMLVKVSKKGTPLCMILEAPGEHYYNPKQNMSTFPRYINNIISSNNRKIWLVVVEPEYGDEKHRQEYVKRIKHLKTKMRPLDKVVFMFNKIDKTDLVISQGKINEKEVFNTIKNDYKGIFEAFVNENPITRWFNEYLCDIIPFSTGDYSQTFDGDTMYEEGFEYYPEKLWNLIMKIRKG